MSEEKQIVACLGSSTTAGKGQAYDWIGELRTRPGNSSVTFLNFGVGGDLAFNALERLPPLIAKQPDKVVVLVGGNDVLTRVSKKMRKFLEAWKPFPREPSAEWFEESLRNIVREVKAKTKAEIALSSLSPIGEDPTSDDPVQKALNQLIPEYSAIVKRVAEAEGAAYLPLFERLNEAIRAEPGPAFKDIRILSMYRDTFRFYVLRQGSDEIAAKNGWRFHADGIHLNSRGGKILADLVDGFVTG